MASPTATRKNNARGYWHSALSVVQYASKERMKNIALNELIGIDSIYQQLKYRIAARRMDSKPFPHSLISGPSGTGKTQLAESLAGELGYYFSDYEAAVFKNREQIIQTLKQDTDKAASQGKKLLLFIDEIHGFRSKGLQETFYYPMTEWRINLSNGDMEFHPFTLVAATTMRHMLDPAFRNRFDIKLELSRYSKKDISLIISLHLLKRDIQFDMKAVALLSGYCLGIPRDAIKYLEAVIDISLSSGSKIVSVDAVKKFVEIQGLDSEGLTCVHRKYLQLLNNATHPMAIHTLSGVLQLDEGVVKYEIEPVLVEKGMIEINRGRILTAFGKSHLKR